MRIRAASTEAAEPRRRPEPLQQRPEDHRATIARTCDEQRDCGVSARVDCRARRAIGRRASGRFASRPPPLAARIRAWRADLEMGERCAPDLEFNARLRRELEEFVAER
jgi:hypothetical protein